MLQMPAQLNSFHNCYGAGHDEREKDFCSCSAFSMGLHLCEGDAALGKVAGGSGFGFFFSGVGRNMYLHLLSVFRGEFWVNVLQGEEGFGFFFQYWNKSSSDAVLCICACVCKAVGGEKS